MIFRLAGYVVRDAERNQQHDGRDGAPDLPHFAFDLALAGLGNQVEFHFAQGETLQAQANGDGHRREFILPDGAIDRRRELHALQAFDQREGRFAHLPLQVLGHARQAEGVPEQETILNLLAARFGFVETDRALNVGAEVAQRRFNDGQNLVHLR